MPGLGELQRPGDSTLAAPLRPGALSQLLVDLAHAPEASEWEAPILPGETVGRFEILRQIGRGGFGVVYEAYDKILSRSVAFKAIRAEKRSTAEVRAVAEAEAAARLAHPNIVCLYDLGCGERGAWLIMELLRGRSLAERLRDGPLPLREAVRVAVGIARGLAHAHAQGVVHRDLKPSNVFLCEDGQVKVLDFGLAQVFGKEGPAGGTPGYMAPEQANGEPGDERSDVYSLGVLVAEMLTGRRPSSGLAPDLSKAPAALAKLTHRMLAAEPAQRPSGGGEVQDQLTAIQRALEPKRLLWAALSVAVVAVVGATAFAWFWQRPLPPGRLLAAMADATNTTGDPDLDGISELLTSGLEQSRRLSIMARSRLVNLLRDSGDLTPSAIDEVLARKAAGRAQARLVLVPGIRQVGAGFDLSLRAIDLGRGEPLFVLRETAPGKGSVPEALQRLVAAARGALQEEPGDAKEAPVSVIAVAPANAEALRHYARGRKFESEADWDAATESYRRALEADPDFPLAHLELAFWYESRDLEMTRRHIEAARRNLHRLPPKERVLIDAIATFYDDGTQSEMLHHVDRAIANWPEEPRPYTWAINTILYGRGDAVAARPYLEKALSVAALGEGDAIDYLVVLDRLDEALARAGSWSDRSPGWLSYLNLAYVHRHRGEDAQALAAARRSMSFDTPGRRPKWGNMLVLIDAAAKDEVEAELAKNRTGTPDKRVAWLALQGRWREALRIQAASMPPVDAPATTQEGFHIHRAALLAQSGAHPDTVWREIEEQFRAGTSGDVLCRNAIYLTVAGDLHRANRLMDGWWFPDHRGCVRLFRRIQAWKRGDRDGALRGLAELYGFNSNYYRGVILQELGRDEEAVEAFRRYRRTETINYAYDSYFAFGPRSLYLEAVSLVRLGEHAQALAVLERLFRLWDRADPGGPMVREAVALRRRLAGETGRQ